MKEPNCPVSEEQLNGLVDRELGDADTRTVALHVVRCGWCARIVGQLTASEALLRTPLMHERKDAVPSRAFWSRLSERLDDVDSVVRATSPGSAEPATAGTRVGLIAAARRATPPYLPHLAAAGILILFSAVALQRAGLAWFQGVGPAHLVQVHRNAVAEASAPAPAFSMSAFAPASAGVVTSTPTGSPQVSTVRVVDLDGTPAICSVLGSAGRPVTVISTGKGAINLRGMQQLAAFDGRYHVSIQPDGSVVMVEAHGEMWRAAVGRLGPHDLLTLMSRIPARVGYDGSM